MRAYSFPFIFALLLFVAYFDSDSLPFVFVLANGEGLFTNVLQDIAEILFSNHFRELSAALVEDLNSDRMERDLDVSLCFLRLVFQISNSCLGGDILFRESLEIRNPGT